LHPQPITLTAIVARQGLRSLLAPPLPYASYGWVAVRQRFAQFHRSLTLTPLQQQDGLTKRAGVVSCLNRAYYGTSSQTEHSFFVGSWGKNTTVRPPRDVDIYFLLPSSIYHRFQGHSWNRQSALLQEVKGKLQVPYPTTEMKGDGPVVVVSFGSYSVEVVPAFELTTPGRYWICSSRNGGSYKEAAPWAEIHQLDAADKQNAGNLRPLIRMLKMWQSWWDVPIKSFHLELLASAFIAQSPWRMKDWFYFDWLLRDFFVFLYGHANGYEFVPGTFELLKLGDAWQTKALSAYRRAVKACEHERYNRIEDAGDEWQKIFGPEVPLHP
jgi:hypothetical protein